MGRRETRTSVFVERPLGYHSSVIEILTSSREPDERQCQADSLTGAVASERVTEAPKGTLRMDGNHFKECKGIRELDCETYKSSRYESRA